MSEPTFKVFAFYHGDDDGERDQTRSGVPQWKLPSVLAWAAHHGFDSLLIERTDEKPSSNSFATHHVCSDAWCPGGCE